MQVRFVREEEKLGSWKYRELIPGDAMKAIYLNKTFIHYEFGGEPPEFIAVTVEAVPK